MLHKKLKETLEQNLIATITIRFSRNREYLFTVKQLDNGNFEVNNLSGFMSPNMRESWIENTLEDVLKFFNVLKIVGVF